MLPSRLHRRRSYSTTTSLASDSLGDERTEGASSADEPEEADRLRLLSSPLVLLEEKGPWPSGEAGKRVWLMESHRKHRHHHHKHDSNGDDASGTDDDGDHNAKDTLVCGPFFPLVIPPPLNH